MNGQFYVYEPERSLAPPYPEAVRKAVRTARRLSSKGPYQTLNDKKKLNRLLRLIEDHRICLNCKQFKRIHSILGDCLFDTTQLRFDSSFANDPIWRIY